MGKRCFCIPKTKRESIIAIARSFGALVIEETYNNRHRIQIGQAIAYIRIDLNQIRYLYFRDVKRIGFRKIDLNNIYDLIKKIKENT